MKSGTMERQKERCAMHNARAIVSPSLTSLTTTLAPENHSESRLSYTNGSCPDTHVVLLESGGSGVARSTSLDWLHEAKERAVDVCWPAR